VSEPTYQHVTVTRHGDEGYVAELALARAAALNALSTDMARDIAAATAALAADDTVRAVVVTSTSEKAFCVGADLKERNGFSDADLLAQRPHFRAAFGGILDLPVPSIAAQLLTRRIGSSRAADLVFTGRRLDVAEAERIGLADRRVPAGTDRAAALELAATIAGNSPVGVRNAKRALRQGADVDLAAGLEVEDGAWRATAFSGDRAEGVAAFNEKRRANWPGK